MPESEALSRDVATLQRRAREAEHPLFARVYPAWAVEADKRGQAEHRAELLAEVRGRVVEVGAGTGRNFRHYPTTVTEVIAVEPEPRLRRLADAEARTVPVPVRVLDGVASQLPLEDRSCDVGVASCVLCSVPHQDEALRELWRVIRPGGELRFYEHVVSRDRRLARVQRLVDRLFWPKVGGGCHCARDTPAAIERAGFTIEASRRFRFRPSPLIGLWTAPHVLGVARRADTPVT